MWADGLPSPIVLHAPRAGRYPQNRNLDPVNPVFNFFHNEEVRRPALQAARAWLAMRASFSCTPLPCARPHRGVRAAGISGRTQRRSQPCPPVSADTPNVSNPNLCCLQEDQFHLVDSKPVAKGRGQRRFQPNRYQQRREQAEKRGEPVDKQQQRRQKEQNRNRWSWRDQQRVRCARVLGCGWVAGCSTAAHAFSVAAPPCGSTSRSLPSCVVVPHAKNGSLLLARARVHAWPKRAR